MAYLWVLYDTTDPTADSFLADLESGWPGPGLFSVNHASPDGDWSGYAYAKAWSDVELEEFRIQKAAGADMLQVLGWPACVMTIHDKDEQASDGVALVSSEAWEGPPSE